MRPAYQFAEAAAKFESTVELVKEDVRVDGKSVLSILTLGVSQGTSIQLEADGADADDAIQTLSDLVNTGFPTVSQPKSD